MPYMKWTTTKILKPDVKCRIKILKPDVRCRMKILKPDMRYRIKILKPDVRSRIKILKRDVRCRINILKPDMKCRIKGNMRLFHFYVYFYFLGNFPNAEPIKSPPFIHFPLYDILNRFQIPYFYYLLKKSTACPFISNFLRLGR